VLPEIFESVAGEADDDQPNRPGYSHRGDEYKYRSDAALGDVTFGRPFATAKPT
jgi:hypothetical protein